MNDSDQRLDDLLRAARREPPMLSPERTRALLEFVDTHHLASAALSFLHGGTSLVTAAVGFAIGAACTAVVLNRMPPHTGPRAVAAGAPSALAATSPTPQHVPAVVDAPEATSIPVSHGTPATRTPLRDPGHATFVTDQTPAQRGRLFIGDDDTGSVDPQPLIDRFDVSTTRASMSSLMLPAPEPAALLEPVPELFDVPPSTVKGMTFFVESGPLYSLLRGGFHGVVGLGDLNAPQNYATATGGWGVQVAAGVALPLTPWLTLTGAARLARRTATYTAPDIMFVRGAGASPATVPVQLQHATALTFDEVAIEPGVRMLPLTLPVFVDAGLAIGVVSRQSAVYSTTVTRVPAGSGAALPNLPASVSTGSIGPARTQWNVRLGLGAELPLGRALLLDAEVRGDYGLVPVFSDNYPRVLSFTPTLGFRYALR